MGYSTDFVGELKFKNELTASQLAKVKSFLGEDWRDHPEWVCPTPKAYVNYIDLELLDDFSGIKWNGAEKTSGMVESVNLIVSETQKLWPDFGLIGKLAAQGEEVTDRWELFIGEDGLAYRRDIPLVGQKVRCPHCDEEFILEGAA